MLKRILDFFSPSGNTDSNYRSGSATSYATKSEAPPRLPSPGEADWSFNFFSHQCILSFEEEGNRYTIVIDNSDKSNNKVYVRTTSQNELPAKMRKVIEKRTKNKAPEITQLEDGKHVQHTYYYRGLDLDPHAFMGDMAFNGGYGKKKQEYSGWGFKDVDKRIGKWELDKGVWHGSFETHGTHISIYLSANSVIEVSLPIPNEKKGQDLELPENFLEIISKHSGSVGHDEQYLERKAESDAGYLKRESLSDTRLELSTGEFIYARRGNDGIGEGFFYKYFFGYDASTINSEAFVEEMVAAGFGHDDDED